MGTFAAIPVMTPGGVLLAQLDCSLVLETSGAVPLLKAVPLAPLPPPPALPAVDYPLVVKSDAAGNKHLTVAWTPVQLPVATQYVDPEMVVLRRFFGVVANYVSGVIWRLPQLAKPTGLEVFRNGLLVSPKKYSLATSGPYANLDITFLVAGVQADEVICNIYPLPQ